jgi:hypothetical protein
MQYLHRRLIGFKENILPQKKKKKKKNFQFRLNILWGRSPEVQGRNLHPEKRRRRRKKDNPTRINRDLRKN